MKTHTSTLALAATLCLIVGCSDGTTNAGSSTSTGTSSDATSANDTTILANRLQALKRKADGRISGVDYAIAELKMNVASKGSDVQTQAADLIQRIEAQRDAIESKLQDTRADDMTAASVKALEDEVDPMLADLDALVAESRKM